MTATELGFANLASPALDLQPTLYPDAAEVSPVDEDEESDEPEDYSAHSVHAEGVPQCETRLVARYGPPYAQHTTHQLTSLSAPPQELPVAGIRGDGLPDAQARAAVGRMVRLGGQRAGLGCDPQSRWMSHQRRLLCVLPVSCQFTHP